MKGYLMFMILLIEAVVTLAATTDETASVAGTVDAAVNAGAVAVVDENLVASGNATVQATGSDNGNSGGNGGQAGNDPAPTPNPKIDFKSKYCLKFCNEGQAGKPLLRSVRHNYDQCLCI